MFIKRVALLVALSFLGILIVSVVFAESGASIEANVEARIELGSNGEFRIITAEQQAVVWQDSGVKVLVPGLKYPSYQEMIIEAFNSPDKMVPVAIHETYRASVFEPFTFLKVRVVDAGMIYNSADMEIVVVEEARVSEKEEFAWFVVSFIVVVVSLMIVNATVDLEQKGRAFFYKFFTPAVAFIAFTFVVVSMAAFGIINGQPAAGPVLFIGMCGHILAFACTLAVWTQLIGDNGYKRSILAHKIGSGLSYVSILTLGVLWYT